MGHLESCDDSRRDFVIKKVFTFSFAPKSAISHMKLFIVFIILLSLPYCLYSKVQTIREHYIVHIFEVFVSDILKEILIMQKFKCVCSDTLKTYTLHL